jgi:hypothetical protein
LVDFSKDSKFYFNYKIMQGRVFDQLRHLYYGVFNLGIFGLMIIALVTSPLWLTFLFFNLPLIITIGLLLVYTNVRALNIITLLPFRSSIPWSNFTGDSYSPR